MIDSHYGHHLSSTAWRTARVKTFFAQIPWEGAPQVDRFGQAEQTPSAKPLCQQTVRDFFQHFPWDEATEIAAPALFTPVQPGPARATEMLTLDDFSNFF